MRRNVPICRRESQRAPQTANPTSRSSHVSASRTERHSAIRLHLYIRRPQSEFQRTAPDEFPRVSAHRHLSVVSVLSVTARASESARLRTCERSRLRAAQRTERAAHALSARDPQRSPSHAQPVDHLRPPARARPPMSARAISAPERAARSAIRSASAGDRSGWPIRRPPLGVFPSAPRAAAGGLDGAQPEVALSEAPARSSTPTPPPGVRSWVAVVIDGSLASRDLGVRCCDVGASALCHRRLQPCAGSIRQILPCAFRSIPQARGSTARRADPYLDAATRAASLGNGAH